MSRDDSRSIALGVLSGALTTVAIWILGMLLGDLGRNLAALPWSWQVAGVASLVVLAASNLSGFRGRLDVALAMAPPVIGLLLLVLILGWTSYTAESLYSGFIVVLLLVLLAEAGFVGLVFRRTALLVAERGGVGFAATGILVCGVGRGAQRFVLVLNRNLRNGHGLFVPPGGHFIPGKEDPIRALEAKIKAEVGLAAKAETTPPMLPDLEYQRAEGIEWIDAPAFVLHEDIHPRCSRGHTRHFDLVYVCTSDGIADRATRPKYTERDRMEVRVEDCAGSYGAARAAVDLAADAWFESTHGHKASVRDYVSEDLVWQLHLAAKWYRDRHGV